MKTIADVDTYMPDDGKGNRMGTIVAGGLDNMAGRVTIHVNGTLIAERHEHSGSICLWAEDRSELTLKFDEEQREAIWSLLSAMARSRTLLGGSGMEPSQKLYFDGAEGRGNE